MTDAAKITIYEVAAEAGVSIGTVSKVLSNTARVSETTRAKVLKAIEHLDYVPSLAARGVAKGGRTSIIGLLIPFTPAQVLADPHLQGNISGIQEALNERDYTLLLATANKEHDPSSSYQRLLRSRYMDGAVIMETQESKVGGLHRHLLQQHYPWVVLGYPIDTLASYCVHADDLQGARRITEHLISLGHRRIGIINVQPPGPYAFEERLHGYQQILKHNNIIFDDRLVVSAKDWAVESGFQAALQLFKQPNPPTAIFALNDRLALGAMQWVQAQGWHVPNDISIVGFDDIPSASLCTPSLTTVRQPSVAMGYETVKLLYQLLDGGTASSRVVISTELVIRESSTALGK